MSLPSVKSDCWNFKKDIHDNSGTIISDLNTMIDSQKKFMKYEQQVANRPPPIQSNFVDQLRNRSIILNQKNTKDKFKSKSYLLSTGRAQARTMNLDGGKGFLKKSTNSIASCGSQTPPVHATISGTITSKASKASGNFTATASLLGKKKKRTSLFNLFSFTTKNSTSSTSNLPSAIDSSEPISPNSCFTDSPDALSMTDFTRFNEVSEDFTQPLPEYISQWSSSNSTTTESICDDSLKPSARPHSVAFCANSDSQNSQNRLRISKLSLDVEESDEPHRNNITKQNSISTKGFSVPLNASFCLNPVPVNCIQSFSTHAKNKQNHMNDFDSSSRVYKTVASMRSTTNSASLLSFNESVGNFRQDLTNEKFEDDLDDTILFKPGESFNMDEGSCLKELNDRLRYADENKRMCLLLRERSLKGSRLVKQKNVVDDEDQNNKDQNNKDEKIYSNENLYETLNLNTTKEDRFWNSSSSNSPLSNSPKSTTSVTGSNDPASNDSTKSIGQLTNKPSPSMFNAFTSNRTSNSKYDVESKARCLYENNQVRMSPESDSICLSNKDYQFKYTNITTQEDKKVCGEDELESQNKLKQTQFAEQENLLTDQNLNYAVIEEDPTLASICLIVQNALVTADEQLFKEVMVNVKKGVKLRELLKPVCNTHNIDIEKCTAFDQSIIGSTSLVDLDRICDGFSGVRLCLQQDDKKVPLLMKSISSPNESEVRNLRKKSFRSNKSETCCPSNSCSIDENNQATASSNNWHSYFNNKMSISKERANNKQKRNSCIAVMSDLNTSQFQINTPVSAPSNSSVQATAVSVSCSDKLNVPVTSIREAANSLQNIAGNQSANSPVERSAKNKNFRKMSQLIFNNYNSASKNKDQLKASIEKILDNYLIELPKLPSEHCLNTYEPSLYEIEPDWNKFVGESFAQSLCKTQQKQQMAIWELLVTETSHIKTTKIIIDVFMSCLIGLKTYEQTSDLFKEIEINKLFSNIIDVFNCNVNFWQTYLHPIVADLQKSDVKLIDPSRLLDGFTNFKDMFAPYEEFILEKANSLENFKKHTEENEFFCKFITWAENNPLVGRLKIADFMMIPVQRLTKYELLLKKIHQFTEIESKREQIAFIIDCVYALPNSINIKLKYLAQFNNISESIEKYEGIVGPTDEINDILNSYRNLDIRAPLPGCLASATRELIHQGPLKLKDTPKSFDVHCFLFTDLLLITQLKKTKKYKIIRPPVLTNRIVVRELTQTDKAFVVVSLNDYQVPESVYMFISNQAKKWIEFLGLARGKYMEEICKANEAKKDSLVKHNQIVKNILEVDLSTNDSENKNSSESGEEERRDSATTITEGSMSGLHRNRSEEIEGGGDVGGGETKEEGEEEVEEEVEKKNAMSSDSFKSVKSVQSGRQYQQQHNVRFNSRILDRRIQRRNMTDPLSTSSQINSIIDEKHSVLMNSIIKRNSLNDKPKVRQITQLAANLYGDSTSTIISTDSGVSSENNHISYSNESISKSPTNQTTVDESESDSQDTHKIHETVDESKRSSLKQTNSVLSTTSSQFSSSSSSHEPNNMSYSSSFNSNSSGSRYTSKSNSLSKRHKNENTLNEIENETCDAGGDDEFGNGCEANILSGNEGDFESYYDLDEAPINKFESEFSEPSPSLSNNFNEHVLTRRLFSPVKIKNKSLSHDLTSRHKSSTITNTKPTNINQFNVCYDENNNQPTEPLPGDYLDRDLVSSVISQVKFQQPNFLVNHASLAQTKLQKKPLVKIHSTNMTNDLVRMKANDLMIRSGSADHFNNGLNTNVQGMDSHQRMTLVKLLHSTMDATEV